jgi:hypothetical protein
MAAPPSVALAAAAEPVARHRHDLLDLAWPAGGEVIFTTPCTFT